MAFKIGFSMEHQEKQQDDSPSIVGKTQPLPRKSLVEVYFEKRHLTLAYYNDLFDLHPGDMVYVDGKLEGLRGRVVEVNYNFKVRLSDYKKVIAVMDTTVHGQFVMAGGHFMTFDRETLPVNQAVMWFKAPKKEDDVYVSGSDETAFSLDDLGGMNVSPAIAERGRDYYIENRVKYLCVDGNRGYAIVEGNEAYEVEFVYCDGEIRNLVCSCFCGYNCKHEVAVMLQLREMLSLIQEKYVDEHERTGYFAAIDKGVLFAFAIDGKADGKFQL